MKQPVEEVVWTGVVWGAADQDVYSVAVVDGRTGGWLVVPVGRLGVSWMASTTTHRYVTGK